MAEAERFARSHARWLRLGVLDRNDNARALYEARFREHAYVLTKTLDRDTIKGRTRSFQACSSFSTTRCCPPERSRRWWANFDLGSYDRVTGPPYFGE
jgi:hypothetical protein